MADYIERRAAIDALEKEKPIPFVNKDGSIDPFGAGRQNQWYRDGIAIMNLPSADVVEVVRCKDCKHYDLAPNGFNGMCNRQYATFYACDFCSYGEQKDD